MRFPAFTALCCALACATPTKPTEHTSGRLVEVKALPKEHAELLAAYAKDGPEWERARERALQDPALLRFLVENLTVEMIKAHRALGGAETERARRALTRAQRELVRIGEPAVPTLIGLVEVADSVSSMLAVDVLARIGRPAVGPMAALLERGETEARRRAVDALAQLPHGGAVLEPKVRAQLIGLSSAETDWVLRAQCATALGARGARDTTTEPWRVALQARLSDPDPAVAEAAARALAVLGDARATPALVRALEAATRDGDPRRFRSAEAALVALTGQSSQTGVAGWDEWWQRNRARLEGTRPL